MNRVFSNTLSTSTAALAIAGAAASASAATVPFTEDFAVDIANWKDAVGADLSYAATGGPDGSGFVAGSFSFVNSAADDTPVLFRGQGGFDASSDSFIGNWLTDGVTEFSAFVRHDAPVPLNFFTRFASPLNFPGGVAVHFIPVPPNTWTQVAFDISPLNPQFVSFEGSDFNTLFGNIGNVQLGVSVPAALAGSVATYNFDLDQPTITPEPAVSGLFALGCIAMLNRRRPA